MLGDSHYPILRLAIILAKGDTQINELNSPDIEANKQYQLIFDESTNAIQWEKVVFSTHYAGTTGNHEQKMKLSVYFII